MNRKMAVDPMLERDVNALMVCAPLNCSRQGSCFRVARFARDKIREMHVEIAKTDEDECEQYAMSVLYSSVGCWESA